MIPARSQPLMGLLIAAALVPIDIVYSGDDAEPAQRSYDRAWVVEKARELASRPYLNPEMPGLDALSDIDYDQYRNIRYRPEAAIWKDENRNFVLDLLHPGWLFKTPVSIAIVESPEQLRELPFASSLFDYGEGADPPQGDEGLAFSGFRVRYPINRPDVLDEVVVFQGASYFRAVARDQLYGISARGLAVKTASAGGEEYPHFSHFWIEQPEPGAAALRVHALLDSASVTGAYSFSIRPGEETTTEVAVELFPRTELKEVGIAPLTSMFLFDSSDRKGFDDYRNAVHDSDGLQMVTSRYERLWRPLANPRRLQVSLFVDENPKGFGLVQRKRRFSDFEDAEARYDLRPSIWVEPVGDWGTGFIELVEIPTEREIHDNIVAFWRPKSPLLAGRSYSYHYRLHWGPRPPDAAPVARVSATRRGLTFDMKHRQFVVDFTPSGLIPIDLEPVVTASAGEVFNVTGQFVAPASVYRASFAFDPGDRELSELRLKLVSEGRPWSETWLYQWTE